MTETLLLDVGAVPHECCDHGLEALYKSLADRPDESIWEPHHDPFLRDIIEDVTGRGLAILAEIQALLTGFSTLAKADWVRPSGDELSALWARLHAKPSSEFDLDDWLDLIDYALGRYLPDSAIRTEADYLAVRATMIGRVQAALDHPVAAGVAADIAKAVPGTLAGAVKVATWAGKTRTVLSYARQRAADLIVDLRESTRRRLRGAVVDHLERRDLGEPVTSGDLQSAMLDHFGELNRDWRRIAVTETGRAANEGFISSLAPGSRVKRLEIYATACPFCQRIHGMEFDIVDPAKQKKDGWAEVWPGKSNVGRSASPRKRTEAGLVERGEHELWWPASGTQHPHCRGTWTKVEARTLPAGVDPRFDAWLKERLKNA